MRHISPDQYEMIAEAAREAVSAFRRCAAVQLTAEGSVRVIGTAPSVTGAFAEADGQPDVIVAVPWRSEAMRETLWGVELLVRPGGDQDTEDVPLRRILPGPDVQSALWQQELVGLLNMLLDGADEKPLTLAAERVVELADVLQMIPDWVAVSVVANLARCGTEDPALRPRVIDAVATLLRKAPDAFADYPDAQLQQPAPPAEAPPKLDPLPQDIFISEKKGLDAKAPGLVTRDRSRLDRSSSTRR